MRTGRPLMIWRDPEEDWHFAPSERPVIPGSPANPAHPMSRRMAYAAIALLVGVTGGLGNAFVTVNLAQLQGSLGLYSYEIAWLPAAYVMTNFPANLVLLKMRQEWGLRLFAIVFLVLYSVVTFAHIFVHSFASSVAVRAASGLVGAPLTTLGMYYMMQAWPAKRRLNAMMVGVVIPQLALPAARLVSRDLLAFHQWETLYILECGLALVSLSAVLLVRLPPSERRKAFEPLDLLTVALFTSGGALFCAVVAQGRYLWWADTPWLGWALCASVPLLVAAWLIEYHRANPLVATRWLAGGDIMRFVLVAMLARIVFSEQAYAAVGLLSTLGFDNDQFHPLFVIVTLAMLLGMAATGLLVNPRKSGPPVLFAVALIAVAAFLDSHATNLTRPQQLYVSQGLIAFSTAFFMGPGLLFGVTRALRLGTSHIITAFVLYSMIQNVGGLVGSAGLGTFQIMREKVHSNALVQRMVPTDPLEASRLQRSVETFSSLAVDPSIRGAEGASLLSRQVTAEANILAYEDVFQLIAMMAAGAAVYLGVAVFFRVRLEVREERPAAAGIPVRVSR
jgi:MFS family permease